MRPWTKALVGALVLALSACAVGPPRRQAAAPSRDLATSPVASLPPGASVPERYAQALELMQRRQDAEALSLMQDLVASGHVGPLVNLGILQARMDQTGQAISSFRAALQRSPGLPSASHWLASLLRARGQPLEAEAVLRQALRREPENPATHRNLAILYELDLARPEQALEHYRRYRRLGGEQDSLIVEAWIRQLQDGQPLRLAEGMP